MPAKVAPSPMKKLCITKPVVRCRSFSLSATNARNGSMLTLMLASSIHSRPAAIQSDDDVGMMNSAMLEQMAPDQEVGPPPPQPAPRAVAERADDRLHEQAGQRRREPEDRDAIGLRAERLVDGAHVPHLQAPAELDAEEPEAHVPDLPEGEAWSGSSLLSRHAAVWPVSGHRARVWLPTLRAASPSPAPFLTAARPRTPSRSFSRHVIR